MPLNWNAQPAHTQMPHLNLSNAEYEFRGQTRYVYPLLYIPISNLPINVKVALIKKAIEAGDDINQLDPISDKQICFGRPLNFAVEYSRANFNYLKDNIPMIKLLLEHGADPRLPGLYGERSALQEMREMSQAEISLVNPEQNKLVPFLKEAYKLIDKAAKKLNGR